MALEDPLGRPADHHAGAFTEVEIRREHPDAVRVEGSMIVVDLPESEAERHAAMQPRGRR